MDKMNHDVLSKQEKLKSSVSGVGVTMSYRQLHTLTVRYWAMTAILTVAILIHLKSDTHRL